MAQRLGYSPDATRDILEHYPGMFYCVRRLWSIDPAHDDTRCTEPASAKPAPTPRPPATPRTDCTTARAIAYLRANGPATSEVIGVAVGADSSTISSLLGRRPDAVVVIGTRTLFGRRTIHVWGIRE
ncbi:MAG: hypothetical protein E6Q97_34075 [Desulfurellales bacterium]|nr:MAG: hypothetical protein E6Q97_34075 [Desulfurellales bacterium]